MTGFFAPYLYVGNQRMYEYTFSYLAFSLIFFVAVSKDIASAYIILSFTSTCIVTYVYLKI